MANPPKGKHSLTSLPDEIQIQIFEYCYPAFDVTLVAHDRRRPRTTSFKYNEDIDIVGIHDQYSALLRTCSSIYVKARPFAARFTGRLTAFRSSHLNSLQGWLRDNITDLQFVATIESQDENLSVSYAFSSVKVRCIEFITEPGFNDENTKRWMNVAMYRQSLQTPQDASNEALLLLRYADDYWLKGTPSYTWRSLIQIPCRGKPSPFAPKKLPEIRVRFGSWTALGSWFCALYRRQNYKNEFLVKAVAYEDVLMYKESGAGNIITVPVEDTPMSLMWILKYHHSALSHDWSSVFD